MDTRFNKAFLPRGNRWSVGRNYGCPRLSHNVWSICGDNTNNYYFGAIWLTNRNHTLAEKARQLLNYRVVSKPHLVKLLGGQQVRNARPLQNPCLSGCLARRKLELYCEGTTPIIVPAVLVALGPQGTASLTLGATCRE